MALGGDRERVKDKQRVRVSEQNSMRSSGKDGFNRQKPPSACSTFMGLPEILFKPISIPFLATKKSNLPGRKRAVPNKMTVCGILRRGCNTHLAIDDFDFSTDANSYLVGELHPGVHARVRLSFKASGAAYAASVVVTDTVVTDT